MKVVVGLNGQKNPETIFIEIKSVNYLLQSIDIGTWISVIVSEAKHKFQLVYKKAK